MITRANALFNALAFLKAQKAGHTLSMPKNAVDLTELAEWCQKYNLAYWINGKTLTLQIVQDGPDYRPLDPRIPKPGTPIDQLHPGNRFRLIAGLPPLPQPIEKQVDFPKGIQP